MHKLSYQIVDDRSWFLSARSSRLTNQTDHRFDLHFQAKFLKMLSYPFTFDQINAIRLNIIHKTGRKGNCSDIHAGRPIFEAMALYGRRALSKLLLST